VSQDSPEREIVRRGCPIISDFGWDGRCYYCDGDYLKTDYSATKTLILNHEAECPWPAFERAYT
jgi:hypothetical protein